MFHRSSIFIAALLVAACGGGGSDVAADTTDPSTTIASSTSSTTSTTVPPTTTTTLPTTTTLSPEDVAAAEYESDVQAIKQLWRRYSDSWFGGVEAGIQYMTDHNYPAEGCIYADFEALYSDAGEGYQEEVVIDEATIERDDGWPIPGGQAAGTVPDGRIYIMSAMITYSEPGFESAAETLELHATVDGEDVSFFFSCEN